MKTFAVTLVAVAVALVLATKELILCLSGAVLRGVTDAYEPGDRIRVGEIRGRVLDQNLLATQVMEIGPGSLTHQYTGRTVVIPNSLLISGPIFNETRTGRFVLHVIEVPAPAGKDWVTAEKLLLEAALSECRPFLEEARRSFERLESKGWLDIPSVEPRINLKILENRRILFLLRIPVPTQQAWRLEQTILRGYLLSLENLS
ncbi:MAG TPA: mechanosensitive ion channel family protein [Nitrospiria bacterium]|nr:mechanosensitive ion channel family protein [Nitrospiria bacterium]